VHSLQFNNHKILLLNLKYLLFTLVEQKSSIVFLPVSA